MPRKKSSTESLGDGATLGPAARDQLRTLADRIVNLLNDRDVVNEDIEAVFGEAKDGGFDTKVMRKAIRRIRADAAALKAEDEMIDLYVHAIQPDLFADAA